MTIMNYEIEKIGKRKMQEFSNGFDKKIDEEKVDYLDNSSFRYDNIILDVYKFLKKNSVVMVSYKKDLESVSIKIIAENVGQVKWTKNQLQNFVRDIKIREVIK